MSVVSFFKFFDNLIVLWSSLFSANCSLWVLQIYEVLGGNDGLESVSNHDNCHRLTLLFLNMSNCFLDLVLWLRIEGWSSLIEDQYGWFFYQRTSNCNALLLATWEIEHTTDSNKCVEPKVERVNELSICQAKCLFDIFFSRVTVSVKKVLFNTAID